MVHTRSLKQNHLFRRLYQKGKSAAGRELVVYCRKNGLPYNRLGLTTGTKLGHAVVRNRIRRRIREAYRLSEERFALGYDIVVVARHGAVNAGFQEISACLLKQMRKLGLVRKETEHETAPAGPDPVLPK